MYHKITFDLLTSNKPNKYENSKQTFFYQSLYMIKGNSRFFVKKVPVIKELMDRRLANLFAKKKAELEYTQKTLRINNGEFYKFVGVCKTPNELINNYDISPEHTGGELIANSNKGYWDLKGKLKNSHDKFHFRIFDEGLFQLLNSEVEMNKTIH
jgi:hypothetical protein